MLARQDGKPFPYPPSVQGVGPWGGDFEVGADDQAKLAERAPVRGIDRSGAKRAR
jgi:type IV secretion system protein VirD4